jgi:hypothetical protein
VSSERPLPLCSILAKEKSTTKAPAKMHSNGKIKIRMRYPTIGILSQKEVEYWLNYILLTSSVVAQEGRAVQERRASIK